MNFQEKNNYVNDILGYNILEKFEKTLMIYDFKNNSNCDISHIKNKYIDLFKMAIENPKSYNLTLYQIDKRSKIEVIFDILIGSYFEDCFMSIFNQFSKSKIQLNYNRDQKEKFTSEPDFMISGFLKTYFVELKTLKFKSYKDIPIKKSNIKNNEEIIFLLNKENLDVYVLKTQEIINNFKIEKQWGKDCYMIPKEQLVKFPCFNCSFIAIPLIKGNSSPSVAKIPTPVPVKFTKAISSAVAETSLTIVLLVE